MSDNKQTPELEIPEQLAEGWDIFSSWAESRARSGDPLLPGGVFLLQRESVIREELATMYQRVINVLGVSPSCVKVDLKRSEDGRLHPMIDVNPPHLWIQRLELKSPVPGASVKEMAAKYIRGVLDAEYDMMKEAYEHRCQGLHVRCPEYDPPEVIDGLKKDEDKRQAGQSPPAN